MHQLSNGTLHHLPEQLSVPSYDRAALTAGIVHFGVGGFHRSHQAMYLDRLMNSGRALEWAVCGVGVLPSDALMKQVMDAQDCLYTLVVKNPDGSTEGRVIGSIIKYLFAPEDPESVIEQMASETTRVVSLTITEGGYNFHQVTGDFDASNPAVLADLLPGAVPATTFGLIVEALRRRRERGIPPFTVMSCDNIQGNGNVARTVFTAFADLVDPDLGAWIADTVSFPNSMVDRITPATTDADRALVQDRFGVADRWPVVSEDYEQWVLEDAFPLGRPPLEEAGVQLVADVEPYELMKLRLLNASHQALCYLGYLSGYRYAHEVCQDPLFARFLLDYMDMEASPTLQPVPGIDLEAYKHTLLARFANEHVRDTLARLCAESSDRIPKWLVPVIRENLAAGGGIERSAAVVAGWARYAEGTDEQGAPIVVVDRLKDSVMAAAAHNQRDPLSFLHQRALFGDLADSPRFTKAYVLALETLHGQGARSLVERLTATDTLAHGAL
ncbi:mannitol dehydrogenase family protein [uncultured Arthrobacter sp.]|uniref:mannitol dehydrogenase family protein n=1 Tax=uncultured Arthrobacter sp. TaxID=114050 RepID=UPI0025E18D31|nr:mannitol dehydrogenase family protein [uncultured Arthrobacter sp.]